MMSQDQIEDMRRRDRQVQDIADMIEIEEAVRSRTGVQRVMEALRADADKAMFDFCAVNPGDPIKIMALQARVFAFTYAFDVFDRIVKRGQIAEHALRAEDELVNDERE